MATAHVPNARADAECLLRQHGYPGARVEVVRSPGDSVDGCLTLFFLTGAGKPRIALVRPKESGSEVEVCVEKW